MTSKKNDSKFTRKIFLVFFDVLICALSIFAVVFPDWFGERYVPVAVILLVGVFIANGAVLIAMSRRIEKDAEKIEKGNSFKTAFISSISHDIRTPMNAIVGITTLAERRLDDKNNIAECISKIKLASGHLLSLVNNILDISKVEAGTLSLNLSEISLAQAAENLAKEKFNQIKEKNLQFSVFAKNIISETFLADELRLNQIFTNLLSNAINYTPNGGRIQVNFSQEKIPGNKILLVYTVRDNGIGMSKEFQKTMCETFARASDNEISGSGLGLAVVKQLVDLMDGTIECESDVGKGTDFVVKIPLAVTEDPYKTLAFPQSQKNILLLSNDDEFAEDAKDLILSMGKDCDIAKNIELAVNAVLRNNGNDYALAIIDSSSSEKDVALFVKRLLNATDGKMKIALASYCETQIEADAKAAGAQAFIARPFLRSTLYKKLNWILQTEKKDDSKKQNSELAGMKILVAEDNELNWEITSEILELYGIKTFHAENGKACLDIIRNSREGDYDAILMDVQMPIMNGKETTKAIRELGSDYAKNIPIIATTADIFPEDVRACLDSGMNGHISKPIDFDKLRETLSMLRLQ